MKRLLSTLSLILFANAAAAESVTDILAAHKGDKVACSSGEFSVDDLLAQTPTTTWANTYAADLKVGEFLLSFELAQENGKTVIAGGAEQIACLESLEEGRWKGSVLNKLATLSEESVDCNGTAVSVGNLIANSKGELYTQRDGMFAYNFAMVAGQHLLEFRTISNHGFYLPKRSLRCLAKVN